jgi:hypothetical protein
MPNSVFGCKAKATSDTKRDGLLLEIVMRDIVKGIGLFQQPIFIIDIPFILKHHFLSTFHLF